MSNRCANSAFNFNVEVLAVEQHLTAPTFGRADAFADGVEVLLRRGLERYAHVIVPRFGNETDGVCPRLEQRRKSRIVRGRSARTSRHAEGCERGGELS